MTDRNAGSIARLSAGAAIAAPCFEAAGLHGAAVVAAVFAIAMLFAAVAMMGMVRP